jgi:L-threonylcarbamoyladenylate synthase
MKIISNCSASQLKDAALALLSGNLVAFPTETVYGLGADVSNEAAVAKIYEVKKRPTNHPLIVHISSIEQLPNFASEIPKYAVKLAKNFWPGPMTLILPRTNLVRNFVTGGQESVGVRVPDHSVALQLLEQFAALGGLGIAAPSANIFGAVSPTNSFAVEKELGKFLSSNDIILNGGNSIIGVESTIISCIQEVPIILRPGAVTKEMIKNILGLDPYFNSKSDRKNRIRSSGLFKSHYKPLAKVYLSGEPDFGDGFIALNSFLTPEGAIRLASPRTSEEYAFVIYEALRMADTLGIQRVYVIPPTGDGIAVAVVDRLTKAAYRV